MLLFVEGGYCLHVYASVECVDCTFTLANVH